MVGFAAFLDAYIECLLWSETDGDGDSLSERYAADDLAPGARAEIEQDCRAFFNEVADMIAGREGQAGHDFCLTRNGHGSGFWDGGWPKHGDALTAAAEAYGTQNAYVGDDGRVYVHG